MSAIGQKRTLIEAMHNLIAVLLFAWSCVAFAQLDSTPYTTKCQEHVLEIRSHGFEHVNHTVLLDGNVEIKEFGDSSWFIESVRCNKSGFAVTASHRQYGDTTKRRFQLTPLPDRKYRLQ